MTEIKKERIVRLEQLGRFLENMNKELQTLREQNYSLVQLLGIVLYQDYYRIEEPVDGYDMAITSDGGDVLLGIKENGTYIIMGKEYTTV